MMNIEEAVECWDDIKDQLNPEVRSVLESAQHQPNPSEPFRYYSSVGDTREAAIAELASLYNRKPYILAIRRYWFRCVAQQMPDGRWIAWAFLR